MNSPAFSQMVIGVGLSEVFSFTEQSDLLSLLLACLKEKKVETVKLT